MANLVDCQARLERVRRALAAPENNDGALSSGIIMGLSGPEQGERLYVCAHLPPEILVPACRADALPWWEALAAATYFGQLDALRALYAAMRENPGKGTVPDLSTTMTWGCWNYAIIDGVPPAFNGAVLDQLFDWGAKTEVPDYDSGTYYDKALRTAPAGVILSFLKHGASPQHAADVRDTLLTQGNRRQAAEVQQALGFDGFFRKIDEQTLMETKYISDVGCTGTLRTIFNFGARRVNEIFETAGSPGVMTSCNFDDYDGPTIDAARQALEKLGGRPQALSCRLDKKTRPGL